jgi:hypothetical protein
MNTIWKQLLYLHGHALPTDLCWREDPPKSGDLAGASTPKPKPAMLRWREAIRAGLIL